MNEFTSALSNFQSAQRLEKEREKQCIGRSHHVAVSSRVFLCMNYFLGRIIPQNKCVTAVCKFSIYYKFISQYLVKKTLPFLPHKPTFTYITC